MCLTSYFCKVLKLNCHKSLSKLIKNQSNHDSLWFHVGVYILAGSEHFLEVMLVQRENKKRSYNSEVLPKITLDKQVFFCWQ